MKVRYADAAKLQLIDIWRYSKQRWGDARAERYVREIDRKVHAVAEGRRRPRPCPEVLAALSVIPSGSHNVYLTVEDDILQVVAVLHQRMEPGRHIREKQ